MTLAIVPNMARRAPSNPAQRLHEIVKRHADARATHGNHGYDAVWAETLGIDRTEVTSAVAGVFGLIHEIDAALAVTGDEDMVRIANRYRDDWALAVVPHGSGRGQALQQGPTDAAVDALGSVASHLRNTLPEGLIPDEQEAAELHEQVAQLIGDIRDDESIPHEIRTVMLARLHDLAWALDHVELGGAGAIQAALDRLVLAYMVHNGGSGEAERTAWGRAWEKAKAASDLISVPGAWYATAQVALTAGPQVTEPIIRAVTGG